MKYFISNVLLIFSLIFFYSCNKHSPDNKIVLTERIQYPVFIKYPYNDKEFDWWRENMEGPKREQFVNLLLDAVQNGKVKAYSYIDNKLLSQQEINNIFVHYDTLVMNKLTPPFDEVDTVIEKKLDRKNIHRITFLEEWYFDEKNFKMEKKVVGIAPSLTVYDDSMSIKGYVPLFWIYTDENYPINK